MMRDHAHDLAAAQIRYSCSTRVLCVHICSMLADIVQRVYILKYLLWFGAFLLGWNEGGGAHSLYFSNFLGKTRPLSMSTQK